MQRGRHIGCFRLKLFPLSLSGTAFTWFTSLAPNSISTWAQLEQKFHEYFYSGETELRLSDLTMVRQKYNEQFMIILGGLGMSKNDVSA